MEGALKVGRSTADKARALADPHPDFNRRFDWGGEEKTRFGVGVGVGVEYSDRMILLERSVLAHPGSELQEGRHVILGHGPYQPSGGQDGASPHSETPHRDQPPRTVVHT